MSVEPDADARAIMENAQEEEFKHFAMDLEYLLRKKPLWREIAHGILFQTGDIVSHGEEAEEEAGEESLESVDIPGSRSALDAAPSLGIGGLR